MTRKQRYEWILDYFREKMPEVQTELDFGNEFQLLVAVMLPFEMENVPHRR